VGSETACFGGQYRSIRFNESHQKVISISSLQQPFSDVVDGALGAVETPAPANFFLMADAEAMESIMQDDS
jgi:hypothetical protein